MPEGLGGFLANLVRQAAGSDIAKDMLRAAVPLALAYPIGELVAGTRGSGGQPAARAATYRVLGGLAAQQFGHTEEGRKQLLNLLASQNLLSLAPPTVGAKPLDTIYGQPFYRETRTLADFPGLLPESQKPAVTLSRPPVGAPMNLRPPAGAQPTRADFEGVLTPTERALRTAYSGLPPTPQYKAAAGEAMLNLARSKEEAETYAQSLRGITEEAARRRGAGATSGLGFRVGAKGRLTPYLAPERAERPPSVKQQALDAVAQGQPFPGFSMAETKRIAVGPERAGSIIERYLAPDEIREYYLTGRTRDIEQTRVLARLEAIDRDRKGVREKLLLLRPYIDEQGNVLPGVDADALDAAMMSAQLFQQQQIKSLVEAEKSLDSEEQEVLNKLPGRTGAAVSPPVATGTGPPVSGPRYLVKTGKLAKTIVDNSSTLQEMLQKGQLDEADEVQEIP